MFLLRNNSKLGKYVVCVLRFGCINFYTKNAPKLAILSSKIEKISGEEALSPPQIPPQWEGDTAPHTLGAFGTSILAPSAFDLVARQLRKVGQHWCSSWRTRRNPLLSVRDDMTENLQHTYSIKVNRLRSSVALYRTYARTYARLFFSSTNETIKAMQRCHQIEVIQDQDQHDNGVDNSNNCHCYQPSSMKYKSGHLTATPVKVTNSRAHCSLKIHVWMKKAFRETQTCALVEVRRSQIFGPRRRPTSGGRRMAKI